MAVRRLRKASLPCIAPDASRIAIGKQIFDNQEGDAPMSDSTTVSTTVGRRRVMQGGVALLATASVARSLPSLAAAKRIGLGQPDRTAELYKGLMDAIEVEAKRLGYETVQSFTGSTAE